MGGSDAAHINMDEVEIASLQSVFALIERIHSDENLRYLRLPFRRLRLASTRKDREDRLVDYVVALERVLASDSSNETTFRFKLRGAALLPTSFGDVNERIKLMNDMYGLRSRVVRGRADEAELTKMVPLLANVLKAVFLWCLDNPERFQEPQSMLAGLDAAMVAGGSRWADKGRP